MEHEISSKDKTETLENEGKTPDTEKCDEGHVFKKARYAWQIKGHLGTEHDSLNGEASCDKSKSTESVALNDLAHFEYKDFKRQDDSDVNETMLSAVTTEKNSSHHDEESYEKGIKEDYVNSDTQKHSDMIEFIGNKRKVDLLNFEGGCGRSKRLRNIEDINSRNEISNCSANAHPQQDRFMNMQAGIATAANNPDFGRAVSSIIPNFQGFDIPSFIWQKQEMGCAIVDNVFNRTLEEMGLSPDPVVNLSATTRLTVENQSIESAIRNQGLRANSSQSDHSTILRNMEEMRQSATRTDFEHTQSQLSRILASRSNSQTLHSQPLIESHYEEENCAMHDQDLDSVANGNESNRVSSCGPSVAKDIKLDKANNKSAPGNDHSGHCKLKIVSENPCVDHETNHNICDVEKISGPTNEKDEFIFMEDSESIHVHCRDIAEKGSENVLDLAVSAAIMNQGLTFD
ncbi:uncharacterized protein LOC132728538 [Ruditapes philippinarum]|uniref:uncharacterized protein LOC132728538 n=1 Tax=Ruditapes philippinarum TaxID=129788 RepID=UPI00295B1888|nr:uncharacterized protein LOC132728538 [Ruditapes philippinarum]